MLEEYKDILVVSDVSKILRIGRNQTYKLINDGTIKVLRIGRNIRIPKAYLMDYLSSAYYNLNDNMLCTPMLVEEGA